MEKKKNNGKQSASGKFQVFFFAFVILSVLFSIVPSFLSEAKPIEIKPLDSVILQLKWKHQFQFAGYYAALEKGYYKQAGLDVKIVEAKAGEKATNKVLQGEADFGIAMSDLIQLRAQGQPIVALAAIYQHSPTILVAPKSNGINSILDLKGKKIAFEAHSAQLKAYFEYMGLSLNQLDLETHNYSVSKLISGEVDAMSAYSTDEPFMLLAKNIEYNTFSPREVGIDFYGDTLFTSEAQTREHPKRVSAFLKASLKGWKYALENTNETIDLILSKYSKRHSREHLLFEAEMSKKLIMANLVDVGYMSIDRWRHISNTFKQLNRIPPNFSLKGFIYNRNPKLNLYWLYLSLATAVLIAVLLFMVSRRFYNLTTQLQIEIGQREQYIVELSEANEQIKTLKGIIPICMHCKGIRDGEGYWKKIEQYMEENSEAQFSHGICEDCLEKHYPEEAPMMK